METPVTESVNNNSLTIDEMSSLDIVNLMHQEDQTIQKAIQDNIEKIAEAIDLIVNKWKIGGRVFIVGAGTSGRIGILDSVELPPTFSINPERWKGIIAGGKEAMWEPLEQHEDDQNNVIQELQHDSFCEKDVLIAISASGSTPFSVAALRYANQVKATTISISCNQQSISSIMSDIAIELVVGPEIIRGSTRLKAGTAQKIAINMISTVTMVRLGKVYQNEMIDMMLINKKLVKRGNEMLKELTGISDQQAENLMKETNNQLKNAVFMAITNSSLQESEMYLHKAEGHLKQAIKSYLND
ncbi:N-acetylmuramic acid 6-phosphate etherase [Gracilibacillus dipsosauri]|uniref:N-acetylmuramic acid 6-phosphate etherase n=1 Tax=Gracilibacillus dipsosauri TaxID=178340 RepID=A0A317KTG7_9BACI|nr:N-acetylmuramic acid 6-phosphate etherase [Gracilibacillus dipsosauri]PWU66822.1 N-acetylmuramic acid 6-phosphate etherase [Gracilibacillus dipsosauri]